MDGAASSWKLIVAFAAGAALAAIAATVIVTSGGSAPEPAVAHSVGPVIDMSGAVGVDCGPPAAPGLGHPDPLLAQDFTVHDSAGHAYTLGWEIVPYRGTARSYRFGASGNLLALEPVTGGRPVGYGSGTVTFGATSTVGKIKAVITLNAGGSLTVGGSWTCTTGASAGTQVPTTLPAG